MIERLSRLDPAALSRALEHRGFRLTRQRRVVYDHLAGVTTHPTADMVYTAVRREIPNISLATVYKALESLVASGAAQKICYGGDSARYDARMDEHQHTRCTSCDMVSDFDVAEPGSEMIGRLAIPAGFSPDRVRIELSGTCAACTTAQ